MLQMNETLAKEYANRIIREIADYEVHDIGISHMPRRKRVREAIKFLKKDRVHLYLGSMKKETSNWEMLYGGWSATATERLNKSQKIELRYNKLGFDLDFDIPIGIVRKRLFVTMSRHSLERLILRKTPVINNYKDAVEYLNSIIKKVLLNCLAYIENGPHEKNEFIANIDGFVLPIVYNPALTLSRKLGFSFIVKTVMPLDYRGAQKAIQTHSKYTINNNFDDYWDTIHKIHDDAEAFRLVKTLIMNHNPK